jgi:hypothetical protein
MTRGLLGCTLAASRVAREPRCVVIVADEHLGCMGGTHSMTTRIDHPAALRAEAGRASVTDQTPTASVPGEIFPI